jgi:hypothetical protein
VLVSGELDGRSPPARACKLPFSGRNSIAVNGIAAMLPIYSNTLKQLEAENEELAGLG